MNINSNGKWDTKSVVKPDDIHKASVIGKTTPINNISRAVYFPTDRQQAPVSGIRGAIGRWFAELKIPIHADPDKALTHDDYYRLLRSCPAYDRARKRALPKIAGNIWDFEASEESHGNFAKVWKKIFKKIKNFDGARKKLADCLFEGRSWLKIHSWVPVGIKLPNGTVIRLKIPSELVPSMKESYELQSTSTEDGNGYLWLWTEQNLKTGRKEIISDADMYNYITVAYDAELRNKFQGDALQSYAIGYIKAIAYVVNYALVHAEKKAEVVTAIKSKFASMMFTELQESMASGKDASSARIQNMLNWFRSQKQGGTILLGEDDDASVIDVAGQAQNIYISLLEYLNKELETWILATLGGMDSDAGSYAKASVSREEQNDHLAWYQRSLVIEPIQDLVKRIYFYEEYWYDEQGNPVLDRDGKPRLAWSNWQVFHQLGFTQYELPEFILGEVGKDEPADLVPIYNLMVQLNAPIDTEEFYSAMRRKRPEGVPDVLKPPAPQQPPQPGEGEFPPGMMSENMVQANLAEKPEAQTPDKTVEPTNKEETRIMFLLKQAKKLLNELIFQKVVSNKDTDAGITKMLTFIQYLSGLMGINKAVQEMQQKRVDAVEFCENYPALFADKYQESGGETPKRRYQDKKIRERLAEDMKLVEDWGKVQENVDTFTQSFEEAIKTIKLATPLLGSSEDLRKYYYSSMGYGEPVIGAAQADTIEKVNKLQSLLTNFLEAGKTEDVERDIKSVLDSTASYAENVFRTNTATAYSVGKQIKYKPLEDNGFIVGYQFLTAHDTRVRASHAANHGAIISTKNDDLNKLQPPLGYQCRCVLRPITQVEAESKGWLNENGTLKEWFPPTYNADIAEKGFGRRAK